MRPLLLDLFCGAGGCAVGYHRAGFDVVGVDHVPQPRYPFPFVLNEALRCMYTLRIGASIVASDGRQLFIRDFEAIHASPPCQRYSQATFCRGQRDTHPDLYDATRQELQAAGVPWVIENVERSPARNAVMLCGLMFGLRVFRHRLFESSTLLLGPSHPLHGARRIGLDGFACVAGHGGQLTGWAGSGTRRTVPKDHRTVAAWSAAMGIDWMTRAELSQAIPPAYTQFIGQQLLERITSVATPLE